MNDTKQAQNAHVLVVPVPTQSHINPILQFSKRLAFKGIKLTLTPTVYIYRTMHTSTIPTNFDQPIQVRPISDGYDNGGIEKAESAIAYMNSFRINGTKTLAQLIKTLDEEGDPVTAIIYDGHLPWVLNVAKHFSLDGVIFFTQSCSVNSIYYHVQRGLIQLPLTGSSTSTITIPEVLELYPSEAPSFIYKYGSYPYLLEISLEQFSNIDQVNWVLCNIFYDMEEKVVKWMSKMWKVGTIGPTVPSYYLDKRLEGDKDYDLQLLKPSTTLCKDWLDTKSKGSVIYMSFGSTIKLSEEQFEELSRGLRDSNRDFLWVVRETEQVKLPKGFIEETSGQGLVVGWASQLEVLSHEAIGCFVTHCGFNSILEALSLGVPMIGIPQWSDQGTNAKFVEDIWGVGIRAKVDDKGIVRREKLEECVNEIMEGEKSEGIQKNVAKWKKMAKEAVDEGGSSDKSINEFVTYLKGY